jgi:sortase (surface protein transpeptidase)
MLAPRRFLQTSLLIVTLLALPLSADAYSVSFLPPIVSPTGSDLRVGPLGLNPAATDAGVVPVTIRIPDATVDAEVELNEIVDGVMLDPSGPWVVSWFQETSLLGDMDNTVMSGHLDYWDVGPAVFYTVGQLQQDAPIYVTGEDGSSYTYAVDWVETYGIDQLTPETISEIVGPTDYRALTLITCGGEFDEERGQYLSRTIVRARLVDAEIVTESRDQQAVAEQVPAVEEEQEAQEVVNPSASELGVGGNATVTEDGLNLRGNATTDAEVITTLSQGQQVSIIGGTEEADGLTWWQVELDNDTQGWVAEDFLSP